MYMYIMLHKNKHVLMYRYLGYFPPLESHFLHQHLQKFIRSFYMYFILIHVKMGLKSMVFIGNKCQ